MFPQSSKRRKNGGDTYHYSLDEPTATYSNVYSRETSLTVFGSLKVATSTNREVQKADEVWMLSKSWAVDDNAEFALDESEALYENAVDADVMDEPACPPKKKTIRSRLSVSILTLSSYLSAP